MSTETEKRLAAQIAGIKDEVADFMAGLDGALLAGKSVEDLFDEIQERIALYDTPEAVDLFMQMTKGRSGVEIPELVKEVIQAPEGSEAKIIFTVETKDHNPGKSLVGHLGLALFEFNQDQVSCSNLEPRNPAELTDNQKACIGRAKEIPYVASNGFKVRWYNAAAIAEVMGPAKPDMAERLADAMLKDITGDEKLLKAFTQEVDRYNSAAALAVGNEMEVPANKTNQQGQIELLTAALDAARHELDGKYISANATVIDAYQLPDWQHVEATGLVEWITKMGLKCQSSHPHIEMLHFDNGCGEKRTARPGDYIVKYRNTEPGRMTFNVFEPEVFATLYTSAAELLG